MKLNPVESIISPQDLKAVILEVRRYAQWFSQASVKNQVTGIASTEPLVISTSAAALINESSKEKPITQASLDEIIAALEEMDTKSPRIVITLAAPPGTGLKKKLADWCRQNIAPGILVDYRFNSTLLGGMVVQYGSHVYDFSFRRQILAARANFAEVLRRV